MSDQIAFGKSHGRVALFEYPTSGDTAHLQLLKFMRILEDVTSRLYLVTGISLSEQYRESVQIKNLGVRMHPLEAIRPAWFSALLWGFKYLLVQIKMAFYVIWLSRKIDVVVFHYGPHYTLPALFARIFRKKVINMFFMPTEAMKIDARLSLLDRVFVLADKTTIALANRLVVGTENSVRSFGLEKYQRKIVCCLNHWYLDPAFQIETPWDRREYLAGYVGRFRNEKGVIELTKAIPLIKRANPGARFLLVGDGILLNDMKKLLSDSDCLGAVDFPGQMPYEKMPEVFNRMRFHILASFNEVSGAVNMEAMACGTITVANAVGGVPDIIHDGETGFLLADNHPETIARKINELAARNDMAVVVTKAKQWSEDNFSFRVGTLRWSEILYRW